MNPRTYWMKDSFGKFTRVQAEGESLWDFLGVFELLDFLIVSLQEEDEDINVKLLKKLK